MATFKEAFAAARKAKGAGATFEWNGKTYSTDRADDKKSSPKPKARPAAATPKSDATSKLPVTRRGGAAPAKSDATAKLPVTRRGGAAPKSDGKPSVMSEAPKQGTAPKASGNLRTANARDGSPRKSTPKVATATIIPLGKSKGIGGRAAEAVKSFLSKRTVSPGASRKSRTK